VMTGASARQKPRSKSDQRQTFTVSEFVHAVQSTLPMEAGWLVASREHTAATKLQANWRGCSCRKQLLEEGR
jgi:hypothetical protein